MHADNLPILNQSKNSITVEWLLAGACFLCPATTWLLIPGTLSWSDGFVVAAAIIYFSSTALRSGRLELPIFFLASVALVLIASLGSYANYLDPLNPINCLKFLVSLFVIPVVFMWGTTGNKEAVDKMLWFWLAGACLSALVAVLSKYGISVFGLKDQSAIFGQRASGLTYHPNSLAYTCALLIPIATYLTVTTRASLLRWICVAAIGLLVKAIIASGSRSAILAVVVAGLAWLPSPFKNKVRRTELLILAGGVLSLAALVIFLMLSDKPFDDASNALGRLLGNIGRAQQSNDEREIAAQIAYNGFEAAPIFGQGFQYIRVAHNNALQILHSSGLLGFTGAILWWGGVAGTWWRLRSGIRMRGTQHDVFLLRALFSTALVMLVNGAFQPLLTDRNGYISIGLMLGLCLSPKYKQIHPGSNYTPQKEALHV